MMNDIIIIISYFTILLLISFYSKKNNKSDINIIGKDLSNNKILFATTIFVTSVGGGTTLGLSEKIYEGYIYYPIALIITIISDILLAIYVTPKVQNRNIKTAGDILKKHYNEIGELIGGLSTILCAIGYMTIQICCAAYVMNFFLYINYHASLLIVYITIIISTIIGGIRSIFLSHFFQFLAIIMSIPVITIISLNQINHNNDINQIFTIISEQTFKSLPNLAIMVFTFSLISFNAPLIQRMGLARGKNTIKHAVYIKSLFYFLLIIMITINGVASKILFPNIESWQSILYMIQYIIPSGLKAIVLIGLLASFISTADADLNIASNAFLYNIYYVFLDKNKNNNKEHQFISKTCIFGISLVSLYLSLSFNNIIDLAIFASSFWCPVILVPTLAALWNIYVNKNYLILSSFIGLIAFIISHFLLPTTYLITPLIIGFIINFIIFVIGILHKKYLNFDIVVE